MTEKIYIQYLASLGSLFFPLNSRKYVLNLVLQK